MTSVTIEPLRRRVESARHELATGVEVEREKLVKLLTATQKEINRDVVLALYVAGDMFMPDFLRCIAAPGAHYPDAASHYLRILESPLDSRECCDASPMFYPDASAPEDRLKEPNGVIAERLINKDEGKHRVFGSFVTREQIKSRARYIDCSEDKSSIQAILTVNYREKTDRNIWESDHHRSLRNLFEYVRNCYHCLPETYPEKPLKYFLPYIRPADTIIDIHSRDVVSDATLPSDLANILTSIVKGFVQIKIKRHERAQWCGTIHLVNSSTHRLELTASCFSPELKPCLENAQMDFDMAAGEGVISWVAIRRKAIRINELDASQSPQLSQFPELVDLHRPFGICSRSQLAAPITLHSRIPGKSKVLGVLNIECTEPDAFDSDSIGFLSCVANYIAPIILRRDKTAHSCQGANPAHPESVPDEFVLNKSSRTFAKPLDTSRRRLASSVKLEHEDKMNDKSDKDVTQREGRLERLNELFWENLQKGTLDHTNPSACVVGSYFWQELGTFLPTSDIMAFREGLALGQKTPEPLKHPLQDLIDELAIHWIKTGADYVTISEKADDLITTLHGYEQSLSPADYTTIANSIHTIRDTAAWCALPRQRRESYIQEGV